MIDQVAKIVGKILGVGCPVKITAIPIVKIDQRLTLTPEQIVLFCQQWQIAELAVFGSLHKIGQEK